MGGFSANLGFLWKDLPLPHAIRAAARAGFRAVECHWPYREDMGAVRAALSETGLPMLSLNTPPGNLAAGDFGLCAVPGRESEARESIMTALDFAARLDARFVHVMAGKAQGNRARQTFIENLRHAAGIAEAQGTGLLIEPINPFDVPGYFLASFDDAAGIIREVGSPSLRLMLDCYHAARLGEDPLERFFRHRLLIGHIQIAGVPARNEPDRGTLDFPALIAVMRQEGWTAPIGAEYRPSGTTGESLAWLEPFDGG